MCGIAGILTVSTARDTGRFSRELAAMTAAIAHRGPDGEKFWNNDQAQVFLGHRRLSVIDPSPAAAQPMQYAERFTIIYNGEIYNYKELRADLQSLGYRFRTNSDTEVILAAYQEYGSGCLAKFNGMFAMAIWDNKTSSLFLARDRMGEKPLFFTWHEDCFLFASEMKALWAVGISRVPDPHQVLLYLGSGVTGIPLALSQTFYQGIFQLPPAHSALLRISDIPGQELTLDRYWDLERSEMFSNESNFRTLLKESVRKRLRSDVPVGSSLSGGIDSSTVAALVRELGIGNWTGFSAIFPGFEKDESAFIRMLCSQMEIRSITCSPGVDELLSGFDRMLYHQEAPVESASALVQYNVMELAARNGVTVLLDGQGADELLGGYESYIHWFLQEQWRSGKRGVFSRELRSFKENGWKGSWGWSNRLAALFPQAAQEQLIKKQANQIRRIPHLNQEYSNAGFRKQDLYKPLVNSLQDILYFDLTMGRLPELLRYADRNSMAFGREIRLPYLEPELMQAVFSMPSHMKMRNGYSKWVLRHAMSDELPESIAWQKRKIGYEPPQADWMTNERVKQKLSAAAKTLIDRGILQKRYLDRPITNSPADWRVLVLGTLFST